MMPMAEFIASRSLIGPGWIFAVRRRENEYVYYLLVVIAWRTEANPSSYVWLFPRIGPDADNMLVLTGGIQHVSPTFLPTKCLEDVAMVMGDTLFVVKNINTGELP